MDKNTYHEIFIEETRENLQDVNRILLQLEQGGFDEVAVNDGYRVLHTLKGSAGTIGIIPISELTHVMEDLFDVLRNGKQSPDEELLDLLYNGSDMVERMVHELELEGDISLKADDIIAQMKAFTEKSEGRLEEWDDVLTLPLLTIEQEERVMECISRGETMYSVEVIFSEDLQFRKGRAYQITKNLSSIGEVISANPMVEDVTDVDHGIIAVVGTYENPETVLEKAIDVIGVDEVTIYSFETSDYDEDLDEGGNQNEDSNEVNLLAARRSGTPFVSKDKKSVHTSSGNSIRVKSKHLDQLLDLVGEIMINNIRINRISSDLKNRELNQTLKNNARLMGELQDIVLRMRMVPVDFIFNRFPRMVRDLCSENGKDVDFKMKCNDIEIDRSLLDEVGDSMVHLLRNSIDHGIEPRDERIRCGKNPIGSVTLSAFQEQSNIVITIEDDGRGMDPDKILRKAIARGLIQEEEAQRLEEKTILSFIFTPGFSTREEVTDISGRGVGLDVVKTKIEGLGGVVKLDSTPGEGCKISLKLPPSMSIVRAMLVEVDDEKYAIPLENVRETVRVPLKDISSVGESGIFRLRDDVLPVLNAQKEFGVKSSGSEIDMPAVIVEKNDSKACLLVSRLIGQQEIVVKNLGRDLRSSGYFSGATILGDGKVAMILDVGAFV